MNTSQKLSQINKAKEELEKLQAEYDELVNLSPECIIADYIHDKMCHHNHTDGCGWYYEDWKNPGHAHKLYIAKAQQLMRAVSNLMHSNASDNDIIKLCCHIVDCFKYGEFGSPIVI